MIPTLLLALLAGGDPCRAPFTGAGRGLAAPGLTGMPGVFEVPVAASLPEGQLAVAWNDAQRLDELDPIRSQSNTIVTLGILPRLTVGARASVTVTGTAQDYNRRDLSVSAHALLYHESRWLPGLVAGSQDVSGANAIYAARFVAASKSLLGRVRLTGGYGSGIRLLDGPFGAVELAPCDWLRVMAEWDGRQRSVGLRLEPLAARAAAWGLQPSIDVLDRGEQGLVLGVGLRRSLPPARGASPFGELTAAAPDATYPAMPGTVQEVREALAAAGFENIRVRLVADTLLDAQVEQRRWNRDELDAVGAALGVLARTAPVGTAQLRLTLRRVDLPVLTVSAPLAASRAFIAGRLGDEAFGAVLLAAHPAPDDQRDLPAPLQRARGRVDLSLRPHLESQFMTEVSPFQGRLWLWPELSLQLARGLSVSARRGLVAAEGSQFIDALGEANYDRLLVHQALRWPAALVPAGMLGLGQLSVGRFGARDVGLMWDQELTLPSGRWSLGGTVGALGPRAADVQRVVGLGSVTWRHPEWGLHGTVSGGRYQRGDWGAGLDVGRRVGRTELSWFIRRTDVTTVTGGGISLPLAPRRELRPALLRLRSPARWDHSQRMTLFERIPAIIPGVGSPLTEGFGVAEVFGERDWLRPATVLSRVWVLRDAARRWGGW